MSRKGVVTFLIAGLATAAVVLAVSTGFYLRSARSKEKKLENLFNYEAPIFVWDKEALAPGETVSPLLKQTPIRLPDGHIETDKAVQIQRGTWSDGQFTVG